MVETLIAIGITLTVIAVLVPLLLFILLWRQVSRSRVGNWLLIALGLRRCSRFAAARRRGGAAPVHATLRRQWALLARDAVAAGARFSSAVAGLPDGPLRATLAGAQAEVDAAVAEAQRLAVQGDRTERAHRDILAALDSQRRRHRDAPGQAEIESAWAAATRAQHESAERLAQASRAQLCRLQLVVARLHGLTAHALELSTLDHTPQLPAAFSIEDRLTALRLATAEVETAAAV